MVTPTPMGALTNNALTPRLNALADELRAVYRTAYYETLQAADEASRRFETPDGRAVDAAYAADIAGCHATTAALPDTIQRHLAGARLSHRVDESPAVVDSCWLFEHHVFVIEWDYTHDFGDPNALVVQEVTR